MSNRAKTDAAEAIAKLRDYLRGDRHASLLVSTITAYLSDLRRERTVLKDEVASLKRVSSVALERATVLANDLEAANQSLVEARSQVIQLTRDLKDAIDERDSLTRKADLEFEEKFWDAPKSKDNWLRRLSKRFAKIAKAKGPKYKTIAIPEDPKSMAFNISEWIIEGSDDEFIRLGILATLLCLMPARTSSVVFYGYQDDKPENNDGSAKAYTIWWWRQGWFAHDPKEDAMWDKAFSMDKNSRYLNAVGNKYRGI